jgi:dipeptidase E
MGGGGFTMEPENPALDDFILGLAEGTKMPKICLLPTASGDGEAQIRQFHATFGARNCEPSHISLFRLGSRPIPLRETLLAQDIIYVGGGSMLGLLAVWRALGLDVILREAWESGVVMAGLSAGAMCWFEWGVTKSLGHPAPSPGLGFLPGSMSVHMDGEPTRLPICRAAIADGTIPPGYAADDGVGLLFTGAELTDVISSRPNRRALRLGPDGEEELQPRLLEVADRFGPTPEIAEFRRVRALRSASPPATTGGSSRPARAEAGRGRRDGRGSPPSHGSATSRPRRSPPGAGRP